MWSRLSNTNASIQPRIGTRAQGILRRLLLEWLRFLAVLSLDCATVFPSQLVAQDGQPVPPIPVARSQEEVATVILQQAIIQSVWGPPAHCVVRQSVHVFGKELTGVGEYVRGGQGSGKLKFNLRMPAGDQLNTLLQVSDGQRLLSIEAIGERQRRSEVDLGKVRPRLILTSQSLRDPIIAMYLAIGGQAETLRKVYQQYHWETVREGKLGETDVWWLGGRIPPSPRSVRSQAQVDNQLFAENNSGLLPTSIEIAIGKSDTGLPFWLYQVEQGRTSAERSPIDRGVKLRIVTEWASPTPLENSQLEQALFEPPSSNEPLFDETERYLPPPAAVASVPAATTQR